MLQEMLSVAGGMKTFWELGCMGLLEAPDGFFECLPTVISTFAYFTLCPFLSNES